MPQVPWTVGVDRHVKQIHSHLKSALEDAFPAKQGHPKQPFLSDRSWMLVRAKHKHRRMLRYMVDSGKREMRAYLFAVWRQLCCHIDGCSWKLPNMHRKRIQSARIGQQIRQLARDLRTSLAQDKAAYVRHAFNEARQQGPERLAALVRGVAKQGRRFKPPKLAPIPKLEDGKWQADPDVTLDMLGEHFAKAGKGKK